MDYAKVLDELESLIARAKAVPLSASVVIPRDEATQLVRSLREGLPREHEEAMQVLAQRDSVLAQAQENGMRIVEQAKAESERLVSKTEVMKTAQEQAARVVADAEAKAAKLKVNADDYVDAKLANFEILLTKTLKTVSRGRETLRRRLEAAADEVLPLNLDDSGEISGEIPIDPEGGHQMP